MQRHQILLHDLSRTVALGLILGRAARPGDVITLAGDLGAGKTTLTQSIGRGLEVPESCYITSPTFNLLHEYPGRIPLYHMDLYRLNSEDDVISLGFEDYIDGSGLCVIEWPDRLGGLYPDDYLDIELLLHPDDANSRLAFLTPQGNDWLARTQRICLEING